MHNYWLFLNTFLRKPTQVGAVAPSSRALSEMLVDSCDWSQVRYAVEFGPGTGVATEVILSRLHAEAKFFAIERSAELAQATRIRCPRAEVIEGCVTDIARFCGQRQFPHVDTVISGLPWASFSATLQTEIFQAMFRVLRPGGSFATFAYLQGTKLPAGKRFAELLTKNFSSVVKSPVVWRNLPPAFVYRCVR
ncbi:MAG TPA: ribosomal RNA adenine dimethylase domain-containing protein [Planctomycetaceae bacterium]|nr:ribosomal RNA adenine dimethylase domain-containing protein [Planctomycetaceae bacterium]